MPTSSTHLAPLDLALVALYLVAITLFGLRFSKKDGVKDKSLKSYFLADNTIPWWAIGLSIVSAETSTLTIISIPGVAFAGDFGFLQVVIGYMIGRIVVALLFLPRYFRGEMLTAYQLIDQRFGPKLHKLTAGLFLLTRAAAEGVRVFAISIVVGIAIGTGDTLSIAIISALTLLYTFEGGMAAVIWTDVVQMALYVAGTIVALFTLGAHVPGGWGHIYAVAAPLGKFHMLDFTLNLTKAYTFWAGVLGGTFLTMASHGTDQLMVQRLLAARNLRESRLALLSSGAVIFMQFTLFLLIGVGLYVFYGAHPEAFASEGLAKGNDRIFPSFIVHQMPHGVAGLLVAAILAAAMSNLSAALNSLASTTVIDFWVPFRNRAQRLRAPLIAQPHRAMSGSTPEPDTTADTTFISRTATVFWAFVLFGIAVYSIQVGGKGHVVEIALSIASVAYGCLLGVFLLGTLTRFATQTGAIIGMICGLATNLFLYQATFPKPFVALSTHVAFTWYVLIGSAVTFAIGAVASVVLPRKRLALALLLLAGFPMIAGAQATARVGGVRSDKPDFTPVSTLLTQAIADKKLPGAVLLIGHNGRVVFHQAYGLRKLAGEPGLDGTASPAEPMTEDTLFDMASLSKVLVTTTAVLQLWEQGKLDLDAPVAKYLPEFATTTGSPNLPAGVPHDHATEGSVIVGGSSTPPPPPSPTPNPQAAIWKSHITVRQLLTHYSGLPEDISLKDPWGLAGPNKAEGIRRAMASVPYGPPNLTFKYSDINFITLGALVEKLSVETLNDYALARIFAVLGMVETSYHPINGYCSPTSSFIPPPYGHQSDQPHPTRCSQSMDSRGEMAMYSRQPRTAPTAHDNELTAEVNPDYDHLLRGTVHDPTTRRMGGVAGHAGVFSTAADTALFCQALLDKLLHNTGPFPLKQSTLQQATSPQAPATAVATATIFTQDQTTIKGVAQRGLGWDLNTAFSRPRGEIFPISTAAHPGSFGHTGFTGTSIWLDPTSDTYVILLANAIHPRGAPPISALRGQVATAAAKALGLGQNPGSALGAPSFESYPKGGVSSEARPPFFTPATTSRAPGLASETRVSTSPQVHQASYIASKSDFMCPLSTTDCPDVEVFSTDDRVETINVPLSGLMTAQHTSTPTLTGIDVLEQTHFAALKTLAATHNGHLRIGLLTNQSGLDAQGRRTADILLHADPTIELKTLFTPEHGLLGKQDTEDLKAEQDAVTHLPVVSVYGAKRSERHPRQADLKPLDAVVIDLQDVGVRFWTYSSAVGYFLESCAKAKVEVIVLDRPNPIGGVAVEGPISDPGLESYVNFMPTPIRHGMTLGELARYYNAYATEISLDPALLDARAIKMGSDAPDPTLPPATQPGLHAKLTVVPMQHWTRAEYFADTALPWTAPSPNLKTPTAAILYPGVGLVEQTNVSVGRGSPAPFEDLGAPYLKSADFAAYLTARKIPGVLITPSTLTIAEDANHYPSHGQTIPAVHFEVTDHQAFDSPEFGMELLSALHQLYPEAFQLERAKALLVNADVLAAVKAGKDPRDIGQSWQPALNAFKSRRAQVLLYP